MCVRGEPTSWSYIPSSDCVLPWLKGLGIPGSQVSMKCGFLPSHRQIGRHLSWSHFEEMALRPSGNKVLSEKTGKMLLNRICTTKEQRENCNCAFSKVNVLNTWMSGTCLLGQSVDNIYTHLVSQYVRRYIACFLFCKGREDNKMMTAFLCGRLRRALT